MVSSCAAPSIAIYRPCRGIDSDIPGQPVSATTAHNVIIPAAIAT